MKKICGRKKEKKNKIRDILHVHWSVIHITRNSFPKIANHERNGQESKQKNRFFMVMVFNLPT